MKRPGPSPLAKLLEECKDLCLKEGIKRFWFVMPVGMIKERMDRAYGFIQSGGVGAICAVGLRQMTFAAPLNMAIVFVNQEDSPTQHVAGMTGRIFIFDECTGRGRAQWEEAVKIWGDRK